MKRGEVNEWQIAPNPGPDRCLPDIWTAIYQKSSTIEWPFSIRLGDVTTGVTQVTVQSRRRRQLSENAAWNDWVRQNKSGDAILLCFH